MVTQPAVTEQTIATYRQAENANRRTSSRRGNVITLGPEEGSDVMITADLHGNRINFDRLMAIADLDGHPGRHLVMQEVCHGGPRYPCAEQYSDPTGAPFGACMSHLLLEDIARLKAEFPTRFHFLLSNHEWAEMRDFPITKSNKLLNLMFRSGLQEMYGESAERVRTASVEFLISCPLAVRIAGGIFVCHSAPERIRDLGFDNDIWNRPLSEADFAPHGDVFRLLWGRDFTAENAAAFASLVQAQVLVHGHEPCSAGFAVPNEFQLILDCCGQNGSYVVVPTHPCLTHSEIVDLVRQLG
jgi:hypothetical protein